MYVERSFVWLFSFAHLAPFQVVDALLKDPATPDVHLILADLVRPRYESPNVITLQADLTDGAQPAERLFETAFGIPDTVYCMHGIMSRQAEDNFDLGLKVSGWISWFFLFTSFNGSHCDVGQHRRRT